MSVPRISQRARQGQVHSRNMRKTSRPRDRAFRPRIAVRQGLWMRVCPISVLVPSVGNRPGALRSRACQTVRLIACFLARESIARSSRPAGTPCRITRAGSPAHSPSVRQQPQTRTETTVPMPVAEIVQGVGRRYTRRTGRGVHSRLAIAGTDAPLLWVAALSPTRPVSHSNTRRPATRPPMSAWPGCARPPER